MPLYQYEVINRRDSPGEQFELFQSMADEPLTKHPETGQPIRRVFHAPAIVEGDGDLAPGIAGLRRARHPVDAFRRIHRQPFVEAKLVEQARLLLDQHAELIALGQIVDGQLIALPVGEVLDQLAVERVADVVGADRGIVGELHA